jgi:polysaccharide biosynthesis protein PslG
MSDAQPHRRFTALIRGLALVLCTGAVLVAGAGTAAAAPGTLFGFNDWNDPSNYFLQPQLGMPVRRMILGWNQVQPTAATWDWSQTDTMYGDIVAHGLQPLIVVQSAPCWANATLPCSDASTGALPPDPAHYGDWSRFIAALAQRYPAALAIEIWNEENLKPEWLPYPDPAAYAAVLKAADAAVKGVAPAMPVISGGLFVSKDSGPYGIGDAQFLSAMYSAGVKGHFDGIGIHPYPIAGGADGTPVRVDVSTTEQTLDALRGVRDLAGDHGTALWITEMGVSTQALAGSAPAAAPVEQAADLIALLSRVQADADVRVALIHRLIDQPLQPGDPAAGVDGYGVFAADGTPKPAACQLSLLFHGTLACPGVTLMTSALYSPALPSPPALGRPAPPVVGPTPSAKPARPAVKPIGRRPAVHRSSRGGQRGHRAHRAHRARARHSAKRIVRHARRPVQRRR